MDVHNREVCISYILETHTHTHTHRGHIIRFQITMIHHDKAGSG